MANNNQLEKYSSGTELKEEFSRMYLVSIRNYFEGDETKARRFMTSVIDAIRRTPKLLNCSKISIINSFMNIAELGFMPSNISGEAYVLPYGEEAQFQLGYKGLKTLLLLSGVVGIRAEIVRKNDKFSYSNGKINHDIDPSKSYEERGQAIGAYVVGSFRGEETSKYMNAKDIVAHGKRFSKSFDTQYTPWKEQNDPELWMWKKTVLKQWSKLMPTNELINKALEMDNFDTDFTKPVKNLVTDSKLQMNNFLKSPDENDNQKAKDKPAKGKPKEDKEEEECPIIDAETGEEVGKPDKK